jgi:hypothetical protein
MDERTMEVKEQYGGMATSGYKQSSPQHASADIQVSEPIFVPN